MINLIVDLNIMFKILVLRVNLIQIYINEFKQLILEGVDIRSCIAIIDRCSLLHTLMKPSEIMKQPACMCIELFLTLLKYCRIDFKVATNALRAKDHFGFDWMKQNHLDIRITDGLNRLSTKYLEQHGAVQYFEFDGRMTYIETTDIYGVVLGIYRYLAGHTRDHWSTVGYSKNLCTTYAETFWRLLDTIS